MPKAKKGDKVKVHYRGILDDGTEFDSSLEREPLEFEVGSGMVIDGFDKAVEGMEVSETKTVEVPKEEAYGDHKDELVCQVERSMLPPDITPEKGLMLEVTVEDGSRVQVFIKDIEDETLTLDGNHPLAGKDLKFELTLAEIV